MYSMYIVVINFPVGQRSGDDEATHSASVSRQASQEVEGSRPAESDDSLARRSSAKMRAMLRDEVLINAQKFKTQVYIHVQNYFMHVYDS